MALRLKNLGAGRVRPLAGGLEGWRRLGFDLAPLELRPGAALSLPSDGQGIG